MTLEVGDRIEHTSTIINGIPLQGEIVVVEKNRRDIITSYYAILDTGTYIQFKPHSLNWRKIQEKVRD